MKSVLITVASLNLNTKEVTSDTRRYMLSGQESASVQYSEMPSTVMLGVDGKLKPFYSGPDCNPEDFR